MNEDSGELKLKEVREGRRVEAPRAGVEDGDWPMLLIESEEDVVAPPPTPLGVEFEMLKAG